ncbi:DUF5040 domain-containing protein [Dysgonomonas sp. 521]|uniref:DUF5040 domain-containing protein n=1 Tax=Dysgonomonas sp. 521 TaxID=2302932 RepID=UPI0013D159AB|nr:DUF5040 domain-containing protein [Dysgonomonas sp. 521]NDV95687.1 DUF5040 domain-containing protein [Dysgonomonas sp. 521]
MKKVLLCLALLIGLSGINAQTTGKSKYTILLTGASFASSNNGWFELGCKELDAKSLNKAVPGTAIADAANLMATQELYSREELEEIDALVIMHVHDKDVASEAGLKKTFMDYPVPFDRSNYAAAYDYVIKRYISECYNLKFDKNSKYYNTPSGKPVIVVLCTHWHDVRTIFNPAVRKLGEKWGFPVVEFDKYIGFSKNSPHPVTGEQYSILYSRNNETIGGVEYGWHPYEGENQYIQQRMAAIFVDLMKKVLPLEADSNR